MDNANKEKRWSGQALDILVKAPKIDIDFMGGQKRVIPERQLWLTVILRATEDLFFLPKLTNTKSCYAIGKTKQAKNIRKSAYSFLFLNTPLFVEHRQFVFENAGVTIPEMRKLRRRADEFEVENS